jgi:hypothetical protein
MVNILILFVGRITHIEIHQRDGHLITHLNGDLPTRYKPSFSKSYRRDQRITDFWKNPVRKFVITYSPPHQVTVLSVSEGFYAHDLVETRLMMANGARFGADPRLVLELVASTSLEFNSPGWRLVASTTFDQKIKSVDGDLKSVGLEGVDLPADVYVFYVTDCQATVRGFCSEVKDVADQ